MFIHMKLCTLMSGSQGAAIRGFLSLSSSFPLLLFKQTGRQVLKPAALSYERVTAKGIYLPLRFLLMTHAPPVRDRIVMPAYSAIPISPVSALLVVSVDWDGVVELLVLGLT